MTATPSSSKILSCKTLMMLEERSELSHDYQEKLLGHKIILDTLAFGPQRSSDAWYRIGHQNLEFHIAIGFL